MKRPVIFTDLDGTLLDSGTYSFSAALPALMELKKRDIPLVICSSKTRVEIEHWRAKLGNGHPFISENGGGIFIPKGYFDGYFDTGITAVESGDYQVIALGAEYSKLREAVTALKTRFKIRGFGDMTIEELMKLANMGGREAEMAKEREFDEPFISDGTADELSKLLSEIEAMGFRHTQGRFFHIMGDSDKGKAVRILKGLYRKKYGEITTVALGDSPNDIEMLQSVNYPVVVMRPDVTHDSRIEVPNLVKANGVGPKGWNIAVMEFLGKLQ